jgi:hypothetical protein
MIARPKNTVCVRRRDQEEKRARSSTPCIALLVPRCIQTRRAGELRLARLHCVLALRGTPIDDTPFNFSFFSVTWN